VHQAGFITRIFRDARLTKHKKCYSEVYLFLKLYHALLKIAKELSLIGDVFISYDR
jgi:hypothetical protein